MPLKSPIRVPCSLAIAHAFILGATPAFAQTPAPPTAPTPPSTSEPQTEPSTPGEAQQGNDAAKPLTKELKEGEGVIAPPAGVDPKMPVSPPEDFHGKTPVIPPPGEPGGNPEMQPK